MITGVLGAASQYNYRRILSFHIVSQIGYMVFGLAMSTPIALAATLFFMAHNILAKTSLFLTSGVAKHLTETSDIRNMGGLYRQAPTLAVLFLISGLALAGIPPLSGFWGKFLLIQSGFTHHFLVLSVIALVVSMITLYSMLKIWHYAYLSPSKEKSSLVFGKGAYAGLIGPLLFLMFVLLVFSLFPQPIYDYCQWVAQSLFQPEQYIQAILGVH
jgi:multicomponent Na+:H+ antiporter subunit D